jgi:glycosyltransferase involved in cell wall biosynthesis
MAMKAICFVPIDLSHEGGGGGVMQVTRMLADHSAKNGFKVAHLGLGAKEKMVLRGDQAFLYFRPRPWHYYLSRIPGMKGWVSWQKEREWNREILKWSRFVRKQWNIRLFEIIEEGGSFLSRYKEKWGIRLILRAHGSVYSWSQAMRQKPAGLERWRSLQRYAFFAADRLMVPSENYLQQLRKELNREGLGQRIWNPIRFSVQEKIADEGPFRFVGRIQDIKGWESLLNAMSILHGKNKAVRLVLHGAWAGTYEKIFFERRMKELGIEDVVEIKNEKVEMGDIYHHSSVLIFPSLWESFGLVPLEAIASGCPVLSSGVGVMPELFPEIPEMNLDPGNSEILAYHMLRLLEEKGYREELWLKEMQALLKLNSNKILEENLDYYNELIESLE